MLYECDWAILSLQIEKKVNSSLTFHFTLAVGFFQSESLETFCIYKKSSHCKMYINNLL